jgi:DNA topoisomerase-3
MTYGCLMLAQTLFRYELWKPYLRSMMEADMKPVSIGTKSKAQVLESCLQQMKACFLDVSWKFLVFHDTCGEYCN